MSFKDFLAAYAIVPSRCPACEKEIDEWQIDERLAHIIRCRWKTTRQIIAAAAKATEPPKLLH